MVIVIVVVILEYIDDHHTIIMRQKPKPQINAEETGKLMDELLAQMDENPLGDDDDDEVAATPLSLSKTIQKPISASAKKSSALVLLLFVGRCFIN